MARRKKPKMVERKLGRELALGLCWQGEDLIEVDPRQAPKDKFITYGHELLHWCYPDLSEEEVERGEIIFEALWDLKYRKIEE